MAMDPSMPPSGGMGMGMDAMHNVLYWGKDVTLLFSSWKTDNLRSYVFSLLAVFVVAALYQLLGKFRQSLIARWNDAKVSAEPGAEPNLEAGWKVEHGRTYRVGAKMLLALLFAINVAVGYLIMLFIMSFNVGVFLAVVLGMTAGYLFTD